MSEDGNQRTSEIVKMREAGATYIEIGKKFGITPSWARQIYAMHCYRLYRQPPKEDVFVHLSGRVANKLVDAGIKSMAQLSEISVVNLRRTRGINFISIREIALALEKMGLSLKWEDK